MNDSGPDNDRPVPGPAPGSAPGGQPTMAEPEDVRARVRSILDRLDRTDGPARNDGPDTNEPGSIGADAGDVAAAGSRNTARPDAADLFEQAHEVMLDALSTVDRA